MEYLIGVILSLAVVALTIIIGFNRERAFYPTVKIVIACSLQWELLGPH